MTFKEFVLLKMGEMSGREFAAQLGVSYNTIYRVIDDEPERPGLTLILAMAKSPLVGEPLINILQIAYPEVTHEDVILSSEARLLAQRIEQLPDEHRQIIYSLLFGMVSGKR